MKTALRQSFAPFGRRPRSQPSPWRPIATAADLAPHTRVDLLMNGDARLVDCCWDPDKGEWYDDYTGAAVLMPDDPVNRITHWMHQPPLPEEKCHEQ